MIIDKIKINRLRGIKEVTVDSLNKINIFFGKNNCGKSTLLEGVFLLSGFSNPLLPININQWRDYFKVSESDLDLIFYNLETKQSIDIQGYRNGEQTRKLEIQKFVSHTKSVDVTQTVEPTNVAENDYYGYKLKFSTDTEKNYSSEILIQEKKTAETESEAKHDAKITKDKRYVENVPAKILLSNTTYVNRISNLRNMITNKQDGVIVEALSKLDHRIARIDLVGNDVLVDIGFPTLVPINLMGDGVRKLLAIIVSIYECADGILIIDEIENGLHHSVMPSLWEIVVDMATKNNVQLFLSTHNSDLLKGLSAVLSQEEYEQYQPCISAHKLLHTEEGTMHAFTYDYQKFNYAMEQEIELR